MKMVLPVGKKKAWELVATSAGLASWLPVKCSGPVIVGGFLKFGWRGGRSEKFRVLIIGEKHSSFRMAWRDSAVIRFYLHGRMTTLTVEVHYPDSLEGRANQIEELTFWAFHLANLKSVALGGPDLRHGLRGRTKEEGFID